MRSTIEAVLFGVLILLGSGQPAVAGIADEGSWQSRARADLDFTRTLLQAAHPGAIDEDNPAFRDWLDQGYGQAMELVPRVRDYDTYLNVLRFYTAGFKDGHLAISDDTRPDTAPIPFKGWIVRKSGDDFIVAATAARWPVALPAIGARLESCDGQTPSALIASSVAPYSDRRDLESTRQNLTALLGEPIFSMGQRLTSCTFSMPDGSRRSMAVTYIDVSFAEWADVQTAARAPIRSENSVARLGEVLWIRAGNFAPDADAFRQLKDMLTNLRRERGHSSVVFDLRGNRGGDSTSSYWWPDIRPPRTGSPAVHLCALSSI